MKFTENQIVLTTTPITLTLPPGVQGTVVDCYERESGEAYEVEIILNGHSFLVTLDADRLS